MDRFKGQYRISSARLSEWDYSSPGYYFITICTKAHQPYFGEVINENMHLTTIGEVANKFWLGIPNHFCNVDIDEFIVMPNHLHGIIIIKEIEEQHKINRGEAQLVDNKVETQHAASLQGHKSQLHKPSHGSVSAIIRSYKSAVTRRAGLNGFIDFAWQRRFYDHIIRDEKSLEKIRAYIRGNPLLWKSDKYYPGIYKSNP